MIDTEKYEGAKKIVEDAGLIDDNEGHLDVHYRKIADLLAEVRRLREDLAEVEELRFQFYAWMLENHDDILNEWEASE